MGWLWRYCPKCSEGMSRPSTVDLVIGHTKCQNCDYEHPLDPDERRWAVEELLETLVRRPPKPPEIS